MPVPTQLSDLNVTAASNSPAATDTLSTTDDYIRALSSILARISAGTDKLATPGTTGAMDVAGNFSVATSKFTVAAASGNTVVAGTLGVTGLTSFGTGCGNVRTDDANKLHLQMGTGGLTVFNNGNTTSRLTISDLGAVAFPAYTGTSFVAGDKYLVIDASGNIHVSAVGPAS